MLHKQYHAISMRNNVREWTHVMLVNTPCSYLHSFCALGMSSGLASKVTLSWVSRCRWGESAARGCICSWFTFLYSNNVTVVKLRFKWYAFYMSYSYVSLFAVNINAPYTLRVLCHSSNWSGSVGNLMNIHDVTVSNAHWNLRTNE
jgi:hypothetical protein